MRTPRRPFDGRVVTTAIAAFCVLAFMDAAAALTRRVPQEYPTIQSALDASSLGDEVLVSAGTYAARSTKILSGPPITGVPSPVTALAFIPTGVALRSEAGAEQTVLDGIDGTVRGVIIHGGKARDAVSDPGFGKSLPGSNVIPTPGPATLEGFTLVNMTNAIVVGNVRFAIRDNVIGSRVELLEATTTGVVEGNRLTGGSFLCYTTSAEGVAWLRNDFEPGFGGMLCRCNSTSWLENAFKNSGGRLNFWPFVPSATVTVSGNTFVGVGVEVYQGYCTIESNRMTGWYGDTAIFTGVTSGGRIAWNTITDCREGIYVGENLEVCYNTIERCNDGAEIGGLFPWFHHNKILNSMVTGMSSYSGTGATVEDNEIRGSAGAGFRNGIGGSGSGVIRRNLIWYNGGFGLEQSYGIIEDNVIAFNDGVGIRTGGGAEPSRPNGVIGPVVARNTVVGNGDDGLRIVATPADSRIESNIVAFNGGDGVECSNQYFLASVGCNDVFANLGAAFAGYCSQAEGADGNFALDPEFCGWESGDFGLRSTSPCAEENAGTCEQVGARGTVCIGVPDAPRRTARSGPRDPVQTSWGSLKGKYSPVQSLATTP